MSKEIGMKKLAELLREYNMSNKSPYILGDADYYIDDGLYAPQIISKSYGFIKWLVENEKIDRDEIIINSDFMPVAFDRKGEKYEWSEEKQLLMLLSIQDEPIEFLISILK